MHLVFLLLKEAKGPLTVTEISSRLQFSHPAIIKITRKMQELGYVKSVEHPADGRKTLLLLTPKAKAELPEFEENWQRISRVVEEVFGKEFLIALDKAERMTQEESFLHRCNKSIKNTRNS